MTDTASNGEAWWFRAGLALAWVPPLLLWGTALGAAWLAFVSMWTAALVVHLADEWAGGLVGPSRWHVKIARAGLAGMAALCVAVGWSAAEHPHSPDLPLAPGYQAVVADNLDRYGRVLASPARL